MSNLHAFGDLGREIQAICMDLLPPVLIGLGGGEVPAPPSLTFPALSAHGYVKSGGALIYVNQPAHALTLTGSDGPYWLALHRNTTTAVADWTRQPGTHLLWRSSGTRPVDPPDGLVFYSVTVAGGAITAASGVVPATPPVPWLGTMSTQQASAVAVTGGSVLGLATLGVTGTTGLNTPPQPGLSLVVGAGTVLTPNIGIGVTPSHPFHVAVQSRLNAPVGLGRAPDAALALAVEGMAYFDDPLGLGRAPEASVRLGLTYTRASGQGILIVPSADTGPGNAVLFANAAVSPVGSITTTAAATAYNTTSDIRLKRNITPLAAALDRVRALRPVQFLWKTDDSPGVGFVAEEVAQVVDGVITGEAGAVDEAGDIVPQQIDHSKLVPWLTAALQETLAQVEALTARVADLEAARA